MACSKLAILVLGLCLTLWAQAQAQQAAPPPAAATPATPDTPTLVRAGLVKSSQGEATRQRGERLDKLVPGLAIAVGDLVRTGPLAYVGITLSDDTLLTLGPGSELLISDYRFDETTQDGGMLASLWRGTLSVVTGLIGKKAPQNVKLQTRTVVMGVRGTEFIVDAGKGAP